MRFKSSGVSFYPPAGWHEVAFEDALTIISKPNITDLEVISILIKMDKKELEKATDLETIHYLKESFLFLQSLPIKKNPEFPKRVLGINLPWVSYHDVFDLGGCEVGQVEDMTVKIKEANPVEEIDMITLFPSLIAIYMQPYIDESEYDFDRANKLVSRIEKEVDFKTVVNMGGFFLMKWNALMDGQRKGWRKTPSLLRKVKRGFMNLVQRLVSTLP